VELEVGVAGLGRVGAQAAGLVAVQQGDDDGRQGLLAGALPEVPAGGHVHGGERHVPALEGAGERVVARPEADELEEQRFLDGRGDVRLGVEEVKQARDGVGMVGGARGAAAAALPGALELEVADRLGAGDGAAPGALASGLVGGVGARPAGQAAREEGAQEALHPFAAGVGVVLAVAPGTGARPAGGAQAYSQVTFPGLALASRCSGRQAGAGRSTQAPNTHL